MQSIDEISTEIVRRESWYVNDADDPGGATKYGVTINTMRRLGLDLTGRQSHGGRCQSPDDKSSA